jgi:hypothetical protein
MMPAQMNLCQDELPPLEDCPICGSKQGACYGWDFARGYCPELKRAMREGRYINWVYKERSWELN